MRKKLYILTTVLFFYQSNFAQHFTPPPVQNSTTGFSGTGANINVVYHRINWTIDPRLASNIITGTVVTYFKTTVANVSSISLDLHSNFNNGSLSISYHGITCANSFTGKIVTITLPSAIISVNTLDSLVINYSGVPPAATGAAQGYQKAGVSPNQYAGSLAESYEDRDWWPCKADMQDKIDSMDINVTVPWVNNANGDTFWVATNGVLYDSAIGAGTRTFKFKTRYPIASYLVCLAVAKFTRYHRTVNINGTNTPVVYYLLRNTANHAAKVATMDQMNLVITALGNKFGDYPFKLEKHGYYDGLVGAGGMEHQTFSGIASGSFNLQTLAHELAHQWFGDNVTFSTWNDLWLAEGFARYSEAFSAELVPALGLNAFAIRNGFKTSALALNAQSAWIPNSNMSTSNLIWTTNYGSTVYERGAMIVSMLRTMSGDTKFSQALTNYQTSLAGKSASADSLKNHFNAVLGIDVSEFFNDYVGGSGSSVTAVGGIGNPINTVNWNTPAANGLILQMGGQSKTAGNNVSYFNGPVVVHATNAASGWTKDTTIVFFDWGNVLSYAGNGITVPVANALSYNLSFTPTHLFYDDSARTLSTGSTNKIVTLDVNVIDFFAQRTTTGNQINLSLAYNEPVEKVILLKSANGTDFMNDGLMIKTNTSGSVINYQFNDVFPFSPVTFYRAKIYMANREKYSAIVKVENSIKKDLVVIPNPANDVVSIRFSNNERAMTTIRVANMKGKTIIESSTKNDFIHIDVSNLPAGIYMVQVMKPGQITGIKKLLVHH
jgi:hypothetical protein